MGGRTDGHQRFTRLRNVELSILGDVANTRFHSLCL